MAKFPLVGVSAVVDGVGSFLRDMGKMDSAVQGTANRANSAGGKIGSVGSKFASVGKAAAGAAVAGVAALGAAVVGIGVVSLKTAIEFESAWAGVVKTTDGLVDKFGNLTEAGEEMQTGFRDLAKVVPLAVEELLEIGELGGQLGVEKENLLEFTEVIAAMGVSTNLTTDAAATGFAQLANVMGTTEKFGSSAFSRLGSSIVALGNTSATTEADILSFAQRMAGASKVAGVTEADMLGISASFTSVGIQAQAGGTAVSKTLLDMNKAVLDGGDQLEIYAATAGLTAEQFGAAWEQDAGAVFGEFVQGLGLAGDDAVAILDALEIKDSQAVRAFLSLAGAGDLVTESMKTANEGWDDNTALAAEAETRYKTTESQMILLKNTLKDVGITIGSALLPFFNKLLQAATPLINQLGKALPKFLNGILIPAMEKVGKVMSGVVDIIAGLIAGTVGIDSPFEDFFPPGIDKIAERVVRAIVPIIDMLKVEIPKAVAAARKFIASSLLPAFRRLGQFVMTQIVPAILQFSQAVIAFAQRHGPAIRNAVIAIGAALVAASIIGTIAGIIAAIVALFNPITIIIGVIALLAAAWTENWFGIREIVASAIAFMLPLFQSLVNFVTSTLIPAFLAFGEFLISVLTPVIQEFSAFMVEAFALVRDWIVENWPTIRMVVETVMGAIKTIVETTIQTIQSIIQAVMQAINGDWAGAWETIKAAAMNVWPLIQSAIETAINFIKDTIIPAAMTAIQALWATAWDIVKSKASEIWAAIQTEIDTAITAVKTKVIEVLDSLGIEWQDNWEDIKRNALVVWDALKIAIDVAMVAIQVIVDTVLSAIQTSFDTTTSAISTTVTTASETIKTAFGEAMDFLQTKAQEVWDAIGPIFQTGIDAAKAVLDGVLPAMRDAGVALIEAIKEGVASAMGGLQDVINDGLDALTDLLPFSKPKNPRSPLRKLPQAGASIVGNILQGLEAAMPALQAELSAALNPTQQAAPVTTIGGNVTTNTNSISIDVISQPASQPSEQAIFFDVSAALAAARGG